jgi:hypothetical protein
MPILHIHSIEAKKQPDVSQAPSGGDVIISQNLQPLRERLLGSFKGFNQFKSLGQREFSLVKGQHVSIQLSTDLKVDITAESLTADEITLFIHAHGRGRGHRVKAKPNSLFFEAIRWRGRVILLAMRPSL